MLMLAFPVTTVPCDSATPDAAKSFAASARDMLFAFTFRASSAGVGFAFRVPLISKGVGPSFRTMLRIVIISAGDSSVRSYFAVIGYPRSIPFIFAFSTFVSP